MFDNIYHIFIIVMFIVAVIGIIICVRRYYVPESITGEIVLALRKSNRALTRRGIAYVIVLSMMVFKIPETEMTKITLIQIVLSLIILASIAWFDFQPQKICQNGILIKTGFISWNMIKKVETVAEMDDIILIRLYKSRLGDKKFNLYCLPGMGNTVESYINQHIGKN